MPRQLGRKEIERDANRLRVLLGAPPGWYNLKDEPFVTVAASVNLTAERVLTGGDSITLTDGGANSTITVDLDTPGTNSVSSTNAATAPHTHQITSSSNPGAAAYILASDASGYLQLVGMGIGAAPASADLHFATAVGITHADGVTDGMVLRANGTRYIPSTLDTGDLTDLAYATPNLTLSTANAAGAANSVIRSDATILVFDATVPTTITVASSAAAGSAGVAARRDHAHGITTSSNPGAAAAILASSAAGKLTLVDLALTSLTASTLIYSDGAKEIESLANSAGYLYNDGLGGFAWASPGLSPHNILSATHSDSAVASVADGDVLIGNVTPAWSKLAISVPGASLINVLGVGNGETRPSWKALLDSTAPATLSVSSTSTSGSQLVAARRDHSHAITTSSNPGANARILASTAAGYLNLEGLYIGITADANTAIRTYKTGTTTNTYSLYAHAIASSGTMSTLRGVYGYAAATGGTPTTARGVDGQVATTSTNMTTGYGVSGAVIVYDGTTMGTGAALVAESPTVYGAGVLTTAYGLLIGSVTAGGTNYAIYTNSGLVRFGGAVRMNTLTASTVVYADASKDIVSLANAAGYLTNNGSGTLSWSSTATAAAHNILDSTYHGDTLTGTVVDGDLIIGNVTPKWSRLARSVPAATLRNILGIDNGETRPSWKALLDSTNPTTLTVSTSAAPGTQLIAARRDHAHAITSTSNASSASILASNASGYLQLTRLGAGTAPSYPLHARSTGIALRVEYDASHYGNFTVSSAGMLQIDSSLSITQISGALWTSSLLVNTSADSELDGAGNVRYQGYLRSTKAGTHWAVYAIHMFDPPLTWASNPYSFSDVGSNTAIAGDTEWEQSGAAYDPPESVKGFLVSIQCRDSASASTSGLYFALYSSSGTSQWSLVCSPSGKPNDDWEYVTGWVVNLSSDDMWYRANASGASTLDVNLYIHAMLI